MKTHKTHAASHNLLGGLLLLSLLSGAVLSINLSAFYGLWTALESQWQNFELWMSAIMSMHTPV